MVIKIHFKLVGTCHKDYNLTKELRNISFKNNLSIKFYTYKKKTIMNNLFNEYFKFVLK